ncbi:MAG: hypothetical protein LKJ83_06545 [Eubacteriaceae bacterium]|jgi:uncharacterized membrane protein YkvI|nr:hypothetical protein [Eubacteriaceae bacterium]
MKNKINWKSVFTVMGAVLAFNIGTGFATGQEVMQYFSVFGWWSILTGAAFVVTMAYGIYCFAYASERFNLTTGEAVLKYYLGNTVGTIINYFYIFYLYMCVIVMYSGAASSLNEQYGAPTWVGAAIIAGLCCLTSLFGLKNIVNVISKIGPVLILIALVVSLITVVQGITSGSLIEGARIVAEGKIKHMQASNSWLIAGVILATSTILWYPNFAVELKQENKMKDLMIGQIIGNGLVGGAEILMALAMIANIAVVAKLNVPFLYIASQIFSGFGAIYAIMIFMALFTTTCPLLWSSITPFAKDGTKKYKILIVAGTVIGFVVAMVVPYDVIMNYVWVISGWVGLGVTIIMVLRVIYNRIKYGKNYNLPSAE